MVLVHLLVNAAESRALLENIDRNLSGVLSVA
jgi:hypothetical protein